LDKGEKRVKLTLKPPLFVNVAAMFVLAGDFQRFEPKLTFQLRANLNGGEVAVFARCRERRYLGYSHLNTSTV
jgi:hypothetical protein